MIIPGENWTRTLLFQLSRNVTSEETIAKFATNLFHNFSGYRKPKFDTLKIKALLDRSNIFTWVFLSLENGFSNTIPVVMLYKFSEEISNSFV